MKRWLKAAPALLRVGFTEAVAWRAELLIWILATTMPLVMMPLWLSLTSDGPVQGMNALDVRAYFLATFIVRQLASAWTSWQINMEVRSGALSARLLKPFPPVFAYALEHIAYIPLRASIALPIAVTLMMVYARDSLPTTAPAWAMFALAVLGAWLLTFSVQVAIGALSFHFESSMKIAEAWTAGYFVLSGYMIPARMFPESMRAALDWLPFRYQLGLPVELLVSQHDTRHALSLLGHQWLLVAVAMACAAIAWKSGVRRFSAFGG